MTEKEVKGVVRALLGTNLVTGTLLAAMLYARYR